MVHQGPKCIQLSKLYKIKQASCRLDSYVIAAGKIMRHVHLSSSLPGSLYLLAIQREPKQWKHNSQLKVKGTGCWKPKLEMYQVVWTGSIPVLNNRVYCSGCARPWSLIINSTGLTAAPTWKWKLNQVMQFASPTEARNNTHHLQILKYSDELDSGDLNFSKVVSRTHLAQVMALSPPLNQLPFHVKHNSEQSCYHEWASKTSSDFGLLHIF